jgi:uncharacterized protein (DUF1697 family)
MDRLVALLRGINVGGRNVIKMADLRTCFEGHGFADVGTYIQSGNVLFSAERDEALAGRIEGMLLETFGLPIGVVIRDVAQMRRTVDRAPEGFGADPQTYRDDVLFLKPPLTAADAIERVPTKEGVDRAWAGTEVLYFSRLAEKASQSRLSRIASMPIYQQMTIRNWNTTTKLLRLMDEAPGR